MRHAKSDDASAIARLHADSWRRTYRGILRDDFLDSEIADERNGVWADRLIHNVDPRRGVILAEVDGALVGFICLYGDHDEQLGSLVDNLHVAAERQRGGVGRTLMRAGARWLCEAGYEASGVYLDVLERNEQAIQFYDALGGLREGPREQNSPDGTRIMSYHMLWASPAALIACCDRATP